RGEKYFALIPPSMGVCYTTLRPDRFFDLTLPSTLDGQMWSRIRRVGSFVTKLLSLIIRSFGAMSQILQF
ncbi:MAG TPA: hypothetical protein VNT76_08985, partial [Candidatus Binatus sp.]|nr:hypothetical protein [Candidatus Binatus sp.]